MQPWTYPAQIERHQAASGSTYLVTFPDIPECITEGAAPGYAALEAADALAAWVAFCLEQGRPVPPPRAARGDEVAIPLEPALAARLALAGLMAEQGLSKVALAARMGKDEKAVRRMLEPKGATLDAVLQALRAVGARPVLSV